MSLLASVTVVCSECGAESTAGDVNDDRMRYHVEDGSMIRLPERALTESEVSALASMFLRCELCQEEHEERSGS